MKLQELSDEQLAWRLLGSLHRIHSAAGVSMGRSQCSRILEAALLLIPMGGFEGEELAGCKWIDFLDEANNRKRKKRPEQTEMFIAQKDGIKYLSSQALVLLLLRELNKLYRESQNHPKRLGELHLELERDIVRAALTLLPRPPKVRGAGLLELLLEADERFRQTVQKMR